MAMRAHNGADALEVVIRHAGKIDLIISDVVMPGLNGPEVVRAIEDQQGPRCKRASTSSRNRSRPRR